MKNRLTTEQEIKLLRDCLNMVVAYIATLPGCPSGLKALWNEKLADIQAKKYVLEEDEDGGRYQQEEEQDGK